jgi:peroxiredoxin
MADQPVRLAVGDDAPGIENAITQGGHFSLKDHRGAWVVVYFFPRSSTPG